MNKLLRTPKWKRYGLAIVCLIPSLLLVWISGSTIALMAFAFMIFVVAVLSFISAFREDPNLDKFDHVMTFSDISKYEKLSHSEFEETDTSFIFQKLGRYALIPKRVIPPDRLEEFRGYAAKVRRSLEETAPPVPLFDRLFPQPPQDAIYRFRYHPNDVAKALLNPLTVVNESTHPVSRKKKRFGAIWLALLVTLLVYFILVPPSRIPWSGPWNLFEIGVLMSAIVLPFLFIRGINAWFRSRAKKRPNPVPPEETRMRLMDTGWAIGSSNSAIFYDWRDVDCFYQNNDCVGFKTMNDLIQIIPKRIFDDRSAAQAFLDQAIHLRREHRRRFEENLVAVETGNPYQPPAI